MNPQPFCCGDLAFLSQVKSLNVLMFFMYQAVIEAGLIAPLVNLLQTAEFDIKKEAAWAISNATSGGTNEQIKYAIFSHSL